MNVFRERAEIRRYKNRNSRFGGWRGMCIKILICIAVFSIIKGYTSINFDNIFWLFNIKSKTVEINNIGD